MSSINDTIEGQERLRKYVDNLVYYCQSYLVDKMLENGTFSYDDIQNFYDEDDEPQEIYEWWIVDSWLLEELKKENEPVLENDYGEWWGRTTTGQAIFLDGIIERIYKKYNK